jgi:hypothetical protein
MKLSYASAAAALTAAFLGNYGTTSRKSTPVKARQTEESKRFYLERAAAKRARRYETPRPTCIFTIPDLPKSRQVRRAEARAMAKV